MSDDVKMCKQVIISMKDARLNLLAQGNIFVRFSNPVRLSISDIALRLKIMICRKLQLSEKPG